jgi:hypothetical protein
MKNKSSEPDKNQNKQDVKVPHTAKENSKKETQHPKNFRSHLYPVLGQKAGDYLREEANVEDLPDEKDEEAYDKKIAETKKQQHKNT